MNKNMEINFHYNLTFVPLKYLSPTDIYIDPHMMPLGIRFIIHLQFVLCRQLTIKRIKK